jgi:hypothetical protein
MPEIIADPPSPSCFRLFTAAEISEFQWLSPDLFFCFARDAGACPEGSGLQDRAEILSDAMIGARSASRR